MLGTISPSSTACALCVDAGALVPSGSLRCSHYCPPSLTPASAAVLLCCALLCCVGAGMKVGGKMRNGSNALIMAAKQGGWRVRCAVLLCCAPRVLNAPLCCGASSCAWHHLATPPANACICSKCRSTAATAAAAQPLSHRRCRCGCCPPPHPPTPTTTTTTIPAGHREAAELLLQRKADPSATDRRGLTAADLCKDPELKELVVAAQAQRDASTAGSEPRAWLLLHCGRLLRLLLRLLQGRPTARAGGQAGWVL